MMIVGYLVWKPSLEVAAQISERISEILQARAGRNRWSPIWFDLTVSLELWSFHDQELYM